MDRKTQIIESLLAKPSATTLGAIDATKKPDFKLLSQIAS